MPRAPASPPDPPAPNRPEDADLPEAVKPIKDKHGQWVMQQLEDGRVDLTLTVPGGGQFSGRYEDEATGRKQLIAFVATLYQTKEN